MEQLDVNTTSAQVEALIEREAIEELYRRVPTVIVGMLIVTPIIIVGIWPYHSPTELLGWLLAIYLAVAQRYIGYRKFSTEGYDAHSSDYWGYYYSLGSFLLGGLLGFGTFIFFYPDSLTHQLVLYIIIIGLTISGINTNSVWPRAYYIYVTSSIGLMASRMLLEGSSEYTAIGMAMLLYIGVASSVAKSANKTFRRTVMLHVKNAELVEQLRQEKQRVEIANQAKTRFLAAASHDLRQPVHSMALFVEALRTEVNTKNGKSLLDFMQSAMDGLNQLLSSLLDISRLDAGVIKPTLLPLSINTLLTDLYNELSPFAQEKGLTLHLRERHETVSSDPVLLANIIRNLLVNAIRYTTKGKILLACRKRRDRLLIQVWDTGPGIPEHELERIFIEFQQLDNPERDRSKGLGLGLAICQRLAKLLGHHLTVHSRVGHGTVFTLDVPLSSEVKDKTSSKIAFESNWDIRGQRILVVDDEITVREGMKAVLERWGCDVVLADGIETAVSQASKQDYQFNAIVADYRLRNETTGVQVIEAIHQAANKKIPAMLVTGDTDPQRIQEAKGSGYLLLHKPVAPGKLRTALKVLQSDEQRADEEYRTSSEAPL